MKRELKIVVENLSKKFCNNIKIGILYTLLDYLFAIFHKKKTELILRKGEFLAIDKVSVTFKSGKVHGIVGHNGSGKSTLLRLISGIYEPDLGSVITSGRVISFLSPGAGFHPHFTVKENIIIYGTLLGISRKQLDKNLENILDFSGLKGFEDRPFGTLSPGMNIRISFAIAIISKPEILLMDEVLSVADTDFRSKVTAALKELSKESIIIFVSHNYSMIKELCDSVIVMQNGKIIYNGKDIESALKIKSTQSIPS